MKVDHAKDSNEKLIDQAADILSHTIPEQKVDAMKDYHKIIRVLKKGDTWRFGPIIEKLELLYIYPGRKLHNAMIVELHELREEMQEKRINQVIDKQRKKDNLGQAPADQPLSWLKSNHAVWQFDPPTDLLAIILAPLSAAINSPQLSIIGGFASVYIGVANNSAMLFLLSTYITAILVDMTLVDKGSRISLF